MICLERFSTPGIFLQHACVTSGEHPSVSVGYYTPPVDSTQVADTLATMIGDMMDAEDISDSVEPTISFVEPPPQPIKKRGKTGMYSCHIIDSHYCILVFSDEILCHAFTVYA
jgi:hypothetical protein